MVVINIAEDNRELNASQRVSLSSRNHTVKFNGVVFEVCTGKVHLLQGLQVHDVQAGSVIHEALGEVIPVNAGIIAGWSLLSKAQGFSNHLTYCGTAGSVALMV